MSHLTNEFENFSQSVRGAYQPEAGLQFGRKLYVEPGVFWVQAGSVLAHADEANLNYTLDDSLVRFRFLTDTNLMVVKTRIYLACVHTVVSSRGPNKDSSVKNNYKLGMGIHKKGSFS